MKFTLTLFVFAAVIVLCSSERIGTMKMVREVNQKTKLWTASLSSPVARMTREEFRSLLAAGPEGFPKKASEYLPRKTYTAAERLAAPESYDPRDHYNCSSMRMVRDQSACGSCWAVAAAATMSDRACIARGGEDLVLSALDILSCSDGGGCDGGQPSDAMLYWADDGVVTEECSPYPFPSCDHHVPGSKNPCPKDDYPTPSCSRKCKNGKRWKSDKHRAEEVYYVSDGDIETELATNGPCEASYAVYEDFTLYTSGIYHHVTGDLLGYHAVKMMGYGVEDGVKYWIITNNWNEHWGEKGLFRIVRGQNECGIEDEIVTGTAKKN